MYLVIWLAGEKGSHRETQVQRKLKVGRIGRSDGGEEGREKAGRRGGTAESWTGQVVSTAVPVQLQAAWASREVTGPGRRAPP